MVAPWLLIAAGVVMTLLTLFVAAVVVQAYGVISGRYVYPIPVELIDLLRMAVGASCTVLGLGSIALWRQVSHEKKSDDVINAVPVVDIEPEPSPRKRIKARRLGSLEKCDSSANRVDSASDTHPEWDGRV